MADTMATATHAHAAGGDVTKRDFLKLVTAATAAVGVGSLAWPLIDSMNPAKDVLALSSTEVELTPIAVGQGITVVWRGKPMFVRHRTPTEIKEAQDVKLSELIDPATDASRVKASRWATSRPIRAANGAAGSAPAMAANTTRPGASATGPRRSIWPSRRMNSRTTPKSKSADAGLSHPGSSSQGHSNHNRPRVPVAHGATEQWPACIRAK
jgi:hypothetical protein